MKVLIINSPLYREPWNNYDEVLPPIWLWYLCTNLKKNGFNVELFDAVAWKISLDRIVDYIEYWNFSHIWVNIFSTNHRLVEEIVMKVSKKVIFIIWWAFTKSNYKDIIHWKVQNEINIVIWEADTIISAIVSWKIQESPIIQDGNKKAYRVDSNSIYFPQDISLLNIDRSFFDYEPTISAKSGKFEWNIITSRGCVYDCAFCSAAVSLNRWNKVRVRRPESVRDEILQIIKLYPDIKSIRILDDLFLRNVKSINDAIEIFSGLNLEWRAMAHIQSFRKVQNGLLNGIKQAGCCELSIWIESRNNDILKSINKINTTEDIRQTIERIFKAWISVKGYFILWFPEESEKQFEDTYNLAKYLKELSISYWVDFRISVFQFRPYHWTQLYYDLVEKWYIIWDIKPTNHITKGKIWEYDFWSWNFWNTNIIILNDFIIKTRMLNDAK